MHIHHDHVGSHGHEHEHTHTHEHTHDGHTHEHEHCHHHDHDHDHPHTHEHLHDHGAEHHHSHDCGCGHDHHHHDHNCSCGHDHHHHDHGHCHSCGGHCEHSADEEMIALMKYMVNHNTAHAKELADLATKLQQAGNSMAYEQVMAAVSDFEKGNMRLSVILASLGG